MPVLHEWDHPRSRGVYNFWGVSRGIGRGSSPLARGLHAHGAVGDGLDRIIPARAGFTLRRRTAKTGPDGSSPLARGLHNRGVVPSFCCRIIPARAGFTWTGGRDSPSRKDHPRSRGVYAERPDDDAYARRIIPARAGFTCVLSRALGLHMDHPRSRGVYPRERGVDTRPCGSSPLARGLRGPRRTGRGRPGIIPARAGFTQTWVRTVKMGRDHPRSRGVYKAFPYRLPADVGSSPLARGLLSPSSLRSRTVRIIPARAGFTRPSPGSTCGRADHPRSRGVYRRRISQRADDHGSSPLARGLPHRPDARANRPRIIPARAGFTPAVSCPAGGRGDHPRSRGVYIAHMGRLG